MEVVERAFRVDIPHNLVLPRGEVAVTLILFLPFESPVHSRHGPVEK
jgi:hypothetical protein